MINWKNYIKQNSKTRKYGSDCQVVSAVNAYYHLTGDIIKQYSKRYKELAELAKACWGSAICIEKVWDELGIETFDFRHSLFHGPPSPDRNKDGSIPKRYSKQILDKMWTVTYCPKENPIEVSVWYKRCGFHSVLIIDKIEQCDAIQVTGFRWETTGHGWIFEEDFNHYVCGNPSVNYKNRNSRRCRSFRLKGKTLNGKGPK